MVWKYVQQCNGFCVSFRMIREQYQMICGAKNSNPKYCWLEVEGLSGALQKYFQKYFQMYFQKYFKSISSSNQKYFTAQDTQRSTSNPKYFNFQLEVLHLPIRSTSKVLRFQLSVLWSEVRSNVHASHSINSDKSSLKTMQMQREITHRTTEIERPFLPNGFPSPFQHYYWCQVKIAVRTTTATMKVVTTIQDDY
jgi:hypothetical protein